jgi:hypothetical protein
MIRPLAREILRRHASHGLRRLFGLRLAQLREPEVEYLHASLRADHDVARFDVAVRDPSLVCSRHRIAHRDTDAEQGSGR